MSTIAVPVLREVRLYGALGRQFGRVFELAVATPAEAVQALCAVLPGFKRAFLGADGRAAYHVYVGRGEQRRTVAEDEAKAPVGQREPIRLVPAIAGAKRQGTGNVIIGYVLFAIGSVLTAYGYGAAGQPLMSAGYGMIIGGVVQLLSPQRTGKDAKNENAPSYAFDGPINNTEQGGPVPIAYGRCIIGSTVVSQGLSTTQLLVPGAYGEGNLPPTPTLPGYEDQGGSGGD